jgi:small-conductance mechanosensitive channel
MIDPRLAASFALIGVLLAVSLLGRRLVARLDLSPEQRQRTRNVLRYVLMMVLVIGLITAWADVVTEAALVASGFAVALVLFHKDLIVNVLGWWQKTMSGAFRIGDRVRIGNLRGDVLDYGLLSTSLMEVDPDATHGMRTGNVLTVPNVKLLTEPVLNETLGLGFEWKEFRFVVAAAECEAAEAALLSAAEAQLAPYRQEVEQALERMSEQLVFFPIEVAPRVFLETTDGDQVVLTLRLVTPSRSLRITQDALTRSFLEWKSGSTLSDSKPL